MKNDDVKPKKPLKSTPTDLRRQAEERLRRARSDVATMPAKDVQQLVHELQVHQVELEMQNEELRRAQLDLEAARNRYADLYDFAPVGLIMVDAKGRIVEANLLACTLLGGNRKNIEGQFMARFIAPDDVDTFHRHCKSVLVTGTREACDLRLQIEPGAQRWVHWKSMAWQDDHGSMIGLRTTLSDSTELKRVEEELQLQRTCLDGIIGSAMDAIVTVDEAERVVLFNHAAEAMFRCTATQAIGGPLDRFIPDRFREAHHLHVRAFADSHRTPRAMGRLGTVWGLRANGEEFPIEASISHVRVGGKQLLTVILRDITERMVTEQALQGSEAFTRSVLDSLSAHICVLDRDGVIVRTNDAWKEFFRRNSDGPVTGVDAGQNYLEVCRRAVDGGQSAIRAILEGIEAVLVGSRRAFSAEYDCHSPDEQRWFLVRVTRLQGASGVVISHVNITEQVEMRQALKEQALLLRDNQQKLEFLSARLIEAQDQERRRIAGDLHDDVSQRLAAVVLDVASLQHHPPLVPELAADALEPIREQLERLADDVHNLAYRLHPSLLEHAGLQPAIEDHIQQVSKRTGLSISLQAREVPDSLSLDRSTCLFRVLQESLHNIAKHANARQATVRLTGSSRGLGLSVTDDGKGFDVGEKTAHHKGLGLISMQERLRMLNGFLRIHSRPAVGTKVCAWIPFKEEGT